MPGDKGIGVSAHVKVNVFNRVQFDPPAHFPEKLLMVRSKQHPNILVFLTDQQHAQHLGCMGTAPVRTPNLDRLASEGTLFTSCYTPCPACLPARASMFTGLTNRAQGIRQNGNPLPWDSVVLPQVLLDAGYRTHAAGKLHLRTFGNPPGIDLSSEDPLDQPERSYHWNNGRIERTPAGYFGFEQPDLVMSHGFGVYGDYRAWLDHNHPGEGQKLGDPASYTGNRYPWAEAEIDPALHYNTWVADRSIDFLDTMAKNDDPFFLWTSFPDPHAPFAALKGYADHYRNSDFSVPNPDADEILQYLPETILELSGGEEGFRQMVHRHGGDNLRNLYIQTFGMIEHIDAKVGRVLHRLEEHAMDNETIVIFLSDHGDQLGEHGLMHKSFWPYDGCCRVPLIIRSPYTQARGRREHTPVSLLDLTPTILDWTNTKMPDDPLYTAEFEAQASPLQSVLPGESLRPVAENGCKPKRGTALIEFDDDLTKAFPCVQMRVLVTKDYKYCYYEPTGESLLFDRANDPEEKNNLSGNSAMREIEQKLLRQLLHEIMRTEPRLPRRVIGY